MSTPPCTGKHEIFDSTHWLDHRMASAICADCPMIEACRDRLAETRELSVYGGDPEGTWAGELIGYRRNSRHLLIEEEMFSDADARAAHAAWNRGDRSHRAGIGERVYQRRIKRKVMAA